MTHEQTALGERIRIAVEAGEDVRISVCALADTGLPLDSLAYADWLTAHRLRMRRLRGGLVRLVDQPYPVPDDIRRATHRSR